MIANAVESFSTQVEWGECDVGAPDGVVEATVDVGRQGIFAGMAARSVPAVVAEGDGFGQGDVEAEWTSHRHGDLSDFESMSESSALVVVGEDEDLGLASQAPEGGCMQDAVSVAFETGAEGIGFFGDQTGTGSDRPGGESGQRDVGQIFAGLAIDDTRFTTARPGVGVRHHDRVGHVAGHGAGPTLGALGDLSFGILPIGDVTSGRLIVHGSEVTSAVWQ